MVVDHTQEYDRVAGEVTATSPAVRSKMFGMPVLKDNGKAFAGYADGGMVFKLAGPDHARALGLDGAHLFDPSGMRPMKEWVVVPAAHSSEWLDLARAALRYVSGLANKGKV